MASVPARQRPRVPRTLARAALAVGAAVLMALAPGVPAQAEPTIEEIEAQLDRQWRQLEPTIEQYNKVHSALKKNRARSAALKKKIQPLSLQADLALNRIGDMATQFYKTGPGADLNALLNSGSSANLAEQLSLLDRLAANERQAIAGVTEVRDRYEAEKSKLDTLIAQQQKQDRELAARRKQIEAEMTRLERLRIAAYGTSTVGGALRQGACPAKYVGGKAGTAAKAACAQIGKPYVFGAGGPGSFDCSGLTQYAWAQAGVYLTHHTGNQWNEGRAVSRAEAQPGDLVFFFSDLSHVGVYVGNGMMVHAPQPGDQVRMASIDQMPIAGFRRPG